MITLQLNGETKTLTAGSSIIDAINDWQLADRSFAVAVNDEFIPKSAYADVSLIEGDRIELLIPMQGG
ncbi:MAG: sulfur carrier protein [Cellvibrionaceae bacterium]|jgi:sulfur carrier protein